MLHLCSIKIFTCTGILAIIYRLYDCMTTNLKLFYDIWEQNLL